MIAVKHSIVLWLLLTLGSATTAFPADYRKVFGTDWEQAVDFVVDHHEAWAEEFRRFGVDSKVAEAVVFPELIRYSKWQDEIEQAAVNGLYVTKGSGGANFSVGRFQMKPSFAEEVERAWNASPLAQEYGFSFLLSDTREARRARVRRLGNEQGQCRYLAIFIRLQQLRLPQLQHVSAEQQVRLLATAYNYQFAASWPTLNRMQHQRRFHTDMIRTCNTRMFCYADIAASFFIANTV